MSRGLPLRCCLALASLLMLLSACVPEQGVRGPTREAQPLPPVVVPPPPVVPVPPSPETQPPQRAPVAPPGGYPRSLKDSNAGPGVLALVRQSQDSRANGRYDAAVGQIERALRIEPRNPFIWQALAEAHLLAGHPDQAESAARKSTSLGRGNPYLEAGNWRLIAGARVKRGDGAGARLASQRADEISDGLASAP